MHSNAQEVFQDQQLWQSWHRNWKSYKEREKRDVTKAKLRHWDASNEAEVVLFRIFFFLLHHEQLNYSSDERRIQHRVSNLFFSGSRRSLQPLRRVPAPLVRSRQAKKKNSREKRKTLSVARQKLSIYAFPNCCKLPCKCAGYLLHRWPGPPTRRVDGGVRWPILGVALLFPPSLDQFGASRVQKWSQLKSLIILNLCLNNYEIIIFFT